MSPTAPGTSYSSSSGLSRAPMGCLGRQKTIRSTLSYDVSQICFTGYISRTVILCFVLIILIIRVVGYILIFKLMVCGSEWFDLIRNVFK